MVDIDISDDYDAVELITWTTADLSAIFWGLQAADIWDIRAALGGSSEIVLMVVGLIGAASLTMTYTDIGDSL
jgi:hypothetical protein